MIRGLFLVFFFIHCLAAMAQPTRWQQHVKYTMDVNTDVTTNRFTGKQKTGIYQ